MIENGDFPVLQVTGKWLDDYFCRKKTSVSALLLAPEKTGFRQAVRNILCGEVMGTMKSPENGRSDRDATHVRPGGRLRGRHSPVFIIIPCHRVVGSNNSLTGHTGGLSLKIGLQEHERGIYPVFCSFQRNGIMESTRL